MPQCELPPCVMTDPRGDPRLNGGSARGFVLAERRIL